MDYSEFDCIDEHLDEDNFENFDDEDFEIGAFISVEEINHSEFWDDINEVNPDDVPF